MIDFFSDWNLNKWWKRKLAGLGVNKKNTRFGFKVGHCAICGREDIVFPSGELHVGDKCYEKMKDNGAEITYHDIKINLRGEPCNVCGKTIYKVHIVQTYICNKCTRKIGEKAKEYREDYRKKIGARKIA